MAPPQIERRPCTVADFNDLIETLISARSESGKPAEVSLWQPSIKYVEVLPKETEFFDKSAGVESSGTDAELRVQKLLFREAPAWMDRYKSPEKQWLRETLPALINVLLRISSKSWLLSWEMSALYHTVTGLMRKEVAIEYEFGSCFQNLARTPSFPTPIITGIRDGASIAVLGGNRAIGEVNNHWYLIMMDVRKGTVYFIDSIAPDNNAFTHYNRVFHFILAAWDSAFSTEPPLHKLHRPNTHLAMRYFIQPDGWSCGLAAIAALTTILVTPISARNAYTQSAGKGISFGPNDLSLVRDTVQRTIRWKVPRNWKPTEPPGLRAKAPKPPAPKLLEWYGIDQDEPANLDDSIITSWQSLLTKELPPLGISNSGNRAIAVVLKDLHGEDCTAWKERLIPEQPDTVHVNWEYKDGYLDQSKTSLFSDCVGPADRKLTWRKDAAVKGGNALISMTAKRWLSDDECKGIACVLLHHYDSRYNGGQIAIHIEDQYGMFMQLGPEATWDSEWDSKVQQDKRQYILFGWNNGQHWMAVLVDLPSQVAYLFDSGATPLTRMNEGYDTLCKAWSLRLPALPMPLRFILAPTIRQTDSYSCGPLSVLSISLIFNNPVAYLHSLLRTKGAHNARYWVEDTRVKIQRHIGLYLVGSIKDLPPLDEPTQKPAKIAKPAMPSKPVKTAPKPSPRKPNILDVVFGPDIPEPENISEADQVNPLKRREHFSPSLPIRPLRKSKPAPRPPPLRQPAENPEPVERPRPTSKSHHKQFKDIPEPDSFDRGDTLADALTLEFSRVALGPGRANQFVRGEVDTPYRWPQETWEQLGNRPLPIYPDGWKGWDWYDRNVEALKAANSAPAPRRSRRGDGDLVQLDEKGRQVTRPN